MPMTNAESPVAGKPKPAPKPTVTSVNLVAAGSSAHAGVQNLLGRRHIAVRNGDAAMVAEVDAELAALGF